MNNKLNVLFYAAIFLAGGLALSSGAQAQTAKDFYKGKTINLIVGFTPGGGYDTYARLLSRHFSRHLPNNPNIIVQNMPGSGSALAVRYLDAGAARDGTVISAFNPGVISEALMNPERMNIKFNEVAWVGSITRDFRVCYAWHTTPIKNWADLVQGKEFVVGDNGIGTGARANSSVLKNLFNFNIKQVTGYPGSAEMSLAIERGELEGQCTSWSSISSDWRRDKKITPLVRFSPVRTPDIPESVQFIGDLAKTQEQKDIIGILIGPGELGRPYIMSKSVPVDRLQVIRTGFDATMNDPAFITEAEKMQLPVNPVTGAAAEAIIARIFNSPPETLEKAKGILK